MNDNKLNKNPTAEGLAKVEFKLF